MNARTWRHMTWTEPHYPQPRDYWVAPLTGHRMAVCAVCGEALIGPLVAEPEDF